MPDPKDVVDELSTKAALAAGRDAARRAVEDLMSSDEERAKKEEERAAKAKRRRKKLVAYAVVGLLLVLGVVGLVVSYWQWFILAGLVGLVGLYGWHRARKWLRGRRRVESPAAESDAKVRIQELASDETDRDVEREARERAMQDRAEREARAVRQSAERERVRETEAREVDEELAAMKARLKK